MHRLKYAIRTGRPFVDNDLVKKTEKKLGRSLYIAETVSSKRAKQLNRGCVSN